MFSQSRMRAKAGMLHPPRRVAEDMEPSSAMSTTIIPIRQKRVKESKISKDLETPCTSRFRPAANSTVSETPCSSKSADLSTGQDINSSFQWKLPANPVKSLNSYPWRKNTICSSDGLEKQNRSESLLNLAVETATVNAFDELNWKDIANCDSDSTLKITGEFTSQDSRAGTNLKDDAVVTLTDSMAQASPEVLEKITVIPETKTFFKPNADSSTTPLETVKVAHEREPTKQITANIIFSDFDSPPCSPGIFSPSVSLNDDLSLSNQFQNEAVSSTPFIHPPDTIPPGTAISACPMIDQANESSRHSVNAGLFLSNFGVVSDKEKKSGAQESGDPTEVFTSADARISAPVENKSNRRSSLLALIDRYKQIKAGQQITSNQPVELSMDDSEFSVSSSLDDIKIETNMNFEF